MVRKSIYCLFIQIHAFIKNIGDCKSKKRKVRSAYNGSPGGQSFADRKMDIPGGAAKGGGGALPAGEKDSRFKEFPIFYHFYNRLKNKT